MAAVFGLPGPRNMLLAVREMFLLELLLLNPERLFWD
jgi:hypothetical protein